MEAVCCIDMGTTRIKAGLVDDHGHVLASAVTPAPGFFQWNAFLAFDVHEYEKRVCQAVREALEGAGDPSPHVAAVALTGQRATCLAAGPDGRTATPALSWQDTSSQSCMDAWVRRFGGDRFSSITGLPTSALWSAARILRLKGLGGNQLPAGARFPLLHDYVLHRLGAEGFVTDPSNASVTGLMDLSRGAWSPEILDACGLSEKQLPAIVPPSSRAGTVSAEAARRTGLPQGTRLVVGGGDQQCAALGVGTVASAEAALCLGTAAVVSCPMDRPAIPPPRGFFCTAHVAEGSWVLEGIHNAFSTTLRWASDLLGYRTPEAFEALASGAEPGASGLLFLPFLAGAGSPDFDARASGVLVGLRQGHTRSDVARAALEGACLEMRRILDAAEGCTGPRRLLLAGGGLPGPLSRDVFARILRREVLEVANREASMTGAAMLAWKGIGRFRTVETAAASLSEKARGPVQAARDCPEYEEIYARYRVAVEAALGTGRAVPGNTIRRG